MIYLWRDKRLFQAPTCSSGVVIIEDKDDETFSYIAVFHKVLHDQANKPRDVAMSNF